jgi:hypothetical protein
MIEQLGTSRMVMRATALMDLPPTRTPRASGAAARRRSRGADRKGHLDNGLFIVDKTHPPDIPFVN